MIQQLPASPSPKITTAPVRLDKWLWAVRLFKTRNLAADACRLSRVTLPNGDPVKPSRETRVGEEFAIKLEFHTRRVRVKALLEKRVSAKLAGDFLEDLTPPAELEKARVLREQNKLAAPVFAPGFGRPTKAQRRALEAWQRAAEGSWDADAAQDPDSDEDAADAGSAGDEAAPSGKNASR